jgi:predicted regulator of Ras-like GTPase activity (Roadblock/LC7/MglB family)
VARRRDLIISDEQMQLIEGAIAKLREASGSTFVALISTSGQPIITYPPDEQSDALSLAALAAGSFAATRQMAEVLSGSDFTLLFHEGKELSLHVVQVSDKVLLLITFGRGTQMGRVRVYTSRALEVLKPILEPAENIDGERVVIE